MVRIQAGVLERSVENIQVGTTHTYVEYFCMSAKEELLNSLVEFRKYCSESLDTMTEYAEKGNFHLMTVPLVMMQQRFMHLIASVDAASIEKISEYNRNRINPDPKKYGV